MRKFVVKNAGSEARDHLANERTFLAWLRTALGLAGLGVVLDGVGLDGHTTVAQWGGPALAGAGLTCIVYATHRYLRVARHLQQGEFPVAMRGPVVVGAVTLLPIAAAVLIYLWR